VHLLERALRQQLHVIQNRITYSPITEREGSTTLWVLHEAQAEKWLAKAAEAKLPYVAPKPYAVAKEEAPKKLGKWRIDPLKRETFDTKEEAIKAWQARKDDLGYRIHKAAKDHGVTRRALLVAFFAAQEKRGKYFWRGANDFTVHVCNWANIAQASVAEARKASPQKTDKPKTQNRLRL